MAHFFKKLLQFLTCLNIQMFLRSPEGTPKAQTQENIRKLKKFKKLKKFQKFLTL